MDQYGMWVWINTYENTIFRGMNIHFNPAILMWTEGVLLVLTHCHVITFHHQTLFDLIYQNQVYRLNQESFWRVYKIPSRMKTEWDMDMESTWINHVYIYTYDMGRSQHLEPSFSQMAICKVQRGFLDNRWSNAVFKDTDIGHPYLLIWTLFFID